MSRPLCGCCCLFFKTLPVIQEVTDLFERESDLIESESRKGNQSGTHPLLSLLWIYFDLSAFITQQQTRSDKREFVLFLEHPTVVGDPCSLNQGSHRVRLNHINKPVINILYPKSFPC